MSLRLSGFVPDICDQSIQLVDGPVFSGPPVTPLGPVDPSQIAVLVRPLVPDRYPVIHEEPDIRFAAYEPEKFERDGLEMHALGGEERKSPGKIESGLSSKIGNRAYAGAIFFGFAFFKN